ncbi:lasso peptide biosynthesis B2 protein [Brevundimonas diminuta]|uniref:lasso peptide biosynthesis B2 protein n=1 Tax=Brevundimonas diminuta TaxID=293 RepID=UPI0030F6ABCA
MNIVWISQGVHMAWRGDDIVVLNIAADAYTCIVGGAQILHPISGAPDEVGVHPDFQSELLSAGLISVQRPQTRRRHAPAPTSVSPVAPAPIGAAFRAARLAFSAGRQFEQSALEMLIRPEAVQFGKAKANGPTPAALTSAFLTALPWLPSPGKCLKRSYALRRQLARAGTPVDWVFGVRTWPFLAHCWLQIDDVLLADDLDRVLGYSPILTV